jgi:RNA-directed DNA polymerase
LNRKVNYRQYCAQNLPSGERLDCAVRKWPNNKLLLKLKEEVTQKQIALVDLAKLKGLRSEAVKRRQTTLLRSLKFRVIAVYKISTSNGAKTPGVDNISFTSYDAYTNKNKCWNIVEQLRKITSNPKKHKPLPVKRVWSPKTRYKKRPIGIPTILDRALQQLICLVLEPLVELTSDSNSFGFREYRSPKMAIGVLRELLKTLDENYIRTSSFKQLEQGVPLILHEGKWILDADIEGFFDNINHDYLVKNVFLPPLAIDLIKSLLTCGIIDKRIFSISDSGVPQGGILSPVLVNFTLNGLQNTVYKAIYPLTKSKARRIPISGTNVVYPSYLEIVRYADDFVVLCRSKFILKSLVIPEINKFLKKRGLCLSSAKTKLFRLKDGIKLKFLGYNFHYEKKWKVKNKFMYSNHVGSRAIALYPDKSKVNSLIRELKQIFKKSCNLAAYNLITILNPRLRRWGSYFNLGNCARYRSLIKNLVYKMCWKWAHKKHKRWGKKRIANFYFLTKEKRKTPSELATIEHSEKKKTNEKKQKFQKIKNIKWSFHGAANSKSSKKSKTIHLYNIVEKGSTVSALTYRVPKNLRNIHAYHSDVLKFIEWSVKANQKAIGPFSN